MAAMIVRTPRTMTMVERPLDLFDEFAREIWGTPSSMRIDMCEGKNELVVKAELSGVHKSNIEITLDGDMLNIRADKKEDTSEGITCYSCERTFGQLTRWPMPRT